MRIINDGYEQVALDTLLLHPRNANKGQVSLISESIETNGFYGAVYVQRSTRYILAGNHTYLAAKENGATDIPVIWVDVDDSAALRIMLADNETASQAERDQAMVAQILKELQDTPLGTAGTGYTPDRVEALIASLTPPEYNPEPPSGFQEVDESLGTEFRCPSCGYEWSGKPK